MGESQEKRGRAQRKKAKRTEKAARKQARRESEVQRPGPTVVEPSHFFFPPQTP